MSWRTVIRARLLISLLAILAMGGLAVLLLARLGSQAIEAGPLGLAPGPMREVILAAGREHGLQVFEQGAHKLSGASPSTTWRTASAPHPTGITCICGRRLRRTATAAARAL